MNAARKTVRAYVELARLSNIPTCFSNVLVGCAIGGLSGWSDWKTIAGMTIAIGLLYIAGMALNDAADHTFDRQQRPGRPIPSGRISIRAAYIFTVICMAMAISLIAVMGVPALLLGLVLVVTIIVYDFLHKKIAASVVLMGLCRGLVYLTAAAAIAWPIDWTISLIFAGTVTIYISIVTLIARSEVAPTTGARRWLSITLAFIAFAPAALVHSGTWVRPAATALLVLAWLVLATRHALAQPPRTKNAILNWLSGICLIDAFYLTLLDQPTFAVAALGCFVLTAIGHRYILGT